MRMEKESLDVILKEQREFHVRVKTIYLMVRAEMDKEKEDSLLLAGLKKLVTEMTEQNTGNINKVVESLKTKKKESTMEARMACVTKPAKDQGPQFVDVY